MLLLFFLNVKAVNLCDAKVFDFLSSKILIQLKPILTFLIVIVLKCCFNIRVRFYIPINYFRKNLLVATFTASILPPSKLSFKNGLLARLHSINKTVHFFVENFC